MQAAQDSHGVSQLLAALERLVEEQVKHVQIITKQEEHLAAIRNQRQQDLGIWNHLGVVVNWLLGACKMLGACKLHL